MELLVALALLLVLLLALLTEFALDLVAPFQGCVQTGDGIPTSSEPWQGTDVRMLSAMGMTQEDDASEAERRELAEICVGAATCVLSR